MKGARRSGARGALAAALSLGLCLAPPLARADPPGVARLAKILRVENGGIITKVFHGPDDFTGVMMQYKNQNGMGFITPDGKYFMVGAMINLRNGELVSQKLMAENLQQEGIVVGLKAAESIDLALSLTAITYGPLHAPNQIDVICDPSNHKGQVVLTDMIRLMAQTYGKNQQMKQELALRVIPVGPDAAGLLSVSNLDALKDLKALVEQGRKPGPASADGNRAAAKIQDALKEFPFSPPFVVMNLPAAKLKFVMNAKHAVATLKRAAGKAPKAMARGR